MIGRIRDRRQSVVRESGTIFFEHAENEANDNEHKSMIYKKLGFRPRWVRFEKRTHRPGPGEGGGAQSGFQMIPGRQGWSAPRGMVMTGCGLPGSSRVDRELHQTKPTRIGVNCLSSVVCEFRDEIRLRERTRFRRMMSCREPGRTPVGWITSRVSAGPRCRASRDSPDGGPFAITRVIRGTVLPGISGLRGKSRKDHKTHGTGLTLS
jgi:hypothetical protein